MPHTPSRRAASERALSTATTLALAALALAAGWSGDVARAQDRDGAGEQAMVDAINAQRLGQGLAPLARDGRLDAAAVRHSAEMADRDVLEHVSQQSGTPADRVHAAGLDIGEIAENVAMHHDPASAQQSLEASEPHLANMLNPRFTHVGVAAVRDERGVYVTQVFGRIEPAVAGAAPPEVPAIVAPRLDAPELAPPPADAPQQVGAAPGVASPVVVAPEAGVAVAPQTGGLVGAPQVGYAAQVAPGTRATVIVPGAGAGRPVAGYWVCAQSRWWYFPMPPGAQPGQQLQADPSVTGAPPGYAPGACVAGTTAQAVQPQIVQPPPPRVYYPPPPPPIYYAPPPRAYAPPPPPPRVYYPPPRRGPRYIVVQPRPGAVVAPYAPVYRGGVSIEIGPRPRVRGRVRVR